MKTLYESKTLRLLIGFALGIIGMLPTYPDDNMWIMVALLIIMLLAFVDGIVLLGYHKQHGYNPMKAVVFLLGALAGGLFINWL